MKTVNAALVAILLGSLGCGEPAPFQGAETPTKATESAPMSESPASSLKLKTPVAADQQPSQNEAETELLDEKLQVAKPTDAKRGRGYGGGIITEPLRQRFLIQHRITFMQLDKAMQMFKALNDRVPNSQEEYMEKIVKENAVTLPELPDGEEYVYDPKKGELMVRRGQ